MKINLHKNARTTPAQRAMIQKDDQAKIADLAARFGVSETTIRRWKNRNTPFDSPHTPKTIRKALTPVVELSVLLLRMTLRLSLDDLLLVVRRFIYPACSRSGLNRCLKRYGVSKLQNVKKALSIDLNDYRGTYFFYTIVWLPGPDKPDGGIWVQVLLDAFSRYVIADIGSRPGPLNSFLSSTVSQYPLNILGIVHTDPIVISSGIPGPKAPGRMLNDRIEACCRAGGLECRYLEPVENHMRLKIRERWAAMTPGERHLFVECVSRRKPMIMDHIRTCNMELPMKALRGKTPFQVMEHYFKSFPSSFKGGKPYFADFFKSGPDPAAGPDMP